jgi:citrate synthase
MGQVNDVWGGDPRLGTVHAVRDLVGRRSDAIPNVDLALGALTWLAGMPPDAGEAIFAIARTGGWIAHALEEYQEPPLRFRPRARYEGPM